MAFVTIETASGPQQVRVCDNCRTVCVPSRFCSGRCAREFYERPTRKLDGHVEDHETREVT